MARAHRHYIPGCTWHSTHRCHKKEFLLKLSRDSHRWIQWLYAARKRYGLVILNYTATSNHIHLLVVDTDQNAIPKSMQLIAGRTAQEYNQRKNRRGAFWEDRYHATAVQTDRHLLSCMNYIDLNMVPVLLHIRLSGKQVAIMRSYILLRDMRASIRTSCKIFLDFPTGRHSAAPISNS